MKTTTQMFQFYYYVPQTHLEATKAAIFAAGAGKIGPYSCCSWETKGSGQFRPEDGSNPFIGNIGKIEKVSEYKVETVCYANCLKEVIAALKKSHPYEEPAFGAIEIVIAPR
jgi:structural toxin protein (hemagglutinin/hemolysin) RtxA